MPARPNELLLFDLGNVIVEVIGAREIQKYLAGPLPNGQWPAAECWEAFECGRLTPEEFARRFIDEFPLNAEPAAFLADFET